jgi:rhamnulokinase
MNTTYYLACDLGIENGRIILGSLGKGQLTLKEIHTFPIRTQKVKGLLCWDLVSLEKEIFAGIEKAAQLDLPIAGLSTNSWDGDYVLLDAKDRPLQMPACGQNGRVGEATERLLKKVPLSTIYAETGISLTPAHTLFQIEAEHVADPTLFQRAQRFLPIADYLNTRLSGVAACEESLASTTQLYNPQTHAWSPKLFAALDLPGSLMPRLVPSGTAFGPVIDELRKHPALMETRVVATCSHDKAAAIAAIPARSEQEWAYLYADHGSQLGVELVSPIMSSQACSEGFTNEVGLGGSIHFLKNSAGLDLIHACRRACRRAWQVAGQVYSCEQLTRMAQESGPAKAHVSFEHSCFRDSSNILETIRTYCRETGQAVPEKPGEFIRVILESLALGHAETLRQLEGLTGRNFEVLHIVGRATHNELLMQMIADATGLPVIVGPDDAAAIGNILIQALALWHLKSPDHLRSIVSSSFPTRIFKPGLPFEKKSREKFRALSGRQEQSIAA